jgi:tetratricopeptide (TPR) repeat protein
MGVSSRRRSAGAFVAFALLAFALVRSPSALGAPKTSDSAAVESARNRFYRALSLQDQGRWAEALELLEKVAETRESAQVRFNIAFNLEHLGRLAAAARGYERAIELATQSGAENVVSASHDRLGRLAERIARLVVRPAGEGVQVVLDGEALEERALGRPVPVDVGDHLIHAEAPGYKPFRTSLSLAGGETRELRIALEPIVLERPAVAAPKAPPPAPRPPPPLPPESKPSALPYIAGGAAVLSVATAAVFYALRQDALDTMREGCDGGQCPEALRSTNEQGMLYTTVANVALATGIGLAGVSAGLFISEINDGDERRDVGIRASVRARF